MSNLAISYQSKDGPRVRYFKPDQSIHQQAEDIMACGVPCDVHKRLWCAAELLVSGGRGRLAPRVPGHDWRHFMPTDPEADTNAFLNKHQ